PFPGTNPVVVMTQHISQPLKPPHDVDANISKYLSGLIVKMMEKEAEKRPQNAGQLRDLITQCKSGVIPGVKAPTATVSTRPGGKMAAQGSDKVEGVLDSILGFLPQSARLPAVIGALVFACLVLAAIIVWVVLK